MSTAAALPRAEVRRRTASATGRFLPRFHQLSYGLVAMSLLPLFTTEVLGWFLVLPAAAVLAVGYLADVERIEHPIGARAWVAVTVVAVVVTVLRVANPDLRFEAFLHLLLFLMAYRLLNPKGNREILQVYLLSFFQLLVTTAFTPNFSMAPILLGFMVTCTWALTTFQLKRGMDEEHAWRNGTLAIANAPVVKAPAAKEPTGGTTRLSARAATPADGVVNWTWLGLTAAIAVGTFAATFPIFYLIPRLGTGFFLSPLVRTQGSTGFTEKVDLGGVGKIEQNPSLAMRIEFGHGIDDLKKLPPVRHLRGIALNHYDGASWSQQGIESHPILPEDKGRPPPKRFLPGAGPGRGTPVVDYTVYQEPLGTSVLFGFYRPFQFLVGVDALDRLGDDGVAVKLQRTYPTPIKYVVSSAIETPSPAALAAAGVEYPATIEERYLNVPETLDPRVAELARRIAGDAPTPYAQVQLLERYLEEEYTYTLELVRDDSQMPLEDFLFEQRRGHCEYFATALAMMARTLRIPTRVVNGFLQGEWNEIGDYLIVRQSDAHTWAEVYYPLDPKHPTENWVIADPSPRSIAPMTGLGDLGPWQQVTHSFDALRMTWNRYVLDFSVSDQRRAASKAFQWYYLNRHGPSSFLKWLTGGRRGGATRGPVLREVAGGLVIAACVAFAIWNAFSSPLGSRVRRRRKGVEADRSLAHGFYAELLKRLARAGLVKDPAATPREFERALSGVEGAPLEAVQTVTAVFERVRYGGRPLEDADLEEVRHALEEVRRTRGARPRRGAPAAPRQPPPGTGPAATESSTASRPV